jgi:hypothetical protein
VTCTRCKFVRNRALAGGAVWLDYSPASFVDSVFADNAAAETGGAVMAGRYTLRLTRCLLLRNAAALGGAVLCRDCASLAITNSILALNSVAPTASNPDAAGAALLSRSSRQAQVIVEGCTIVGNNGSAAIATERGGGHGTHQPQTVSVRSSIITEPSLLLGPSTEFRATFSLLADRAAACAQAGATCVAPSVIGGDPALVQLSRALSAGALGPDTYWSPTAASPGNGKGSSEGLGRVDFLGNPRVSGGDRAGLGAWAEAQGRGLVRRARAAGRAWQEAARAAASGSARTTPPPKTN